MPPCAPSRTYSPAFSPGHPFTFGRWLCRQPPVGSQAWWEAKTRLVVVRGNRASGKSSVAASLRKRFGRDLAIVSQDNLCRIALRERDPADGANIGLIDLTTRYALDNGFHVVLGGILYADRYGMMLQSLVRAHRGITRCYYLDVPFEATLSRYATKPDATYLAHVTENAFATGVGEVPAA